MGVGFIGLGRMGRGIARNLLRGTGSLAIFDQSAGAMAATEGAGLTENVSSGDREVDRQLGSEVAVRDPPHTVGTEETTHMGASCDQRLLY